MKFFHWNIHGWTDTDGVDNVDRVIDVIQEADPDVISLVEVDEPWGHPVNLQRVADTLGYHWAFIPAFEYREQGGFGNALLSRTPLLNVQQWQLLPPMLYDGSEPTEPRAVVLAQVEAVEGGAVTVGSTHFPRYSEEMRKRAGDRLLGLVESRQGPHVIAGDYNQPYDLWVPERLAVTPAAGPATYPTPDPVESIDYLLVSEGTVSSVGAPATRASDHLPVVGTLDPHIAR